ncbi:MAG: class I SAM-dependent methyltransferase [Candidatus Uhrbacteria bacterium]
MEIILLAIAWIIIGTLALGAFRGAPWVPTRSPDVARVMAIADVKSGEVVADLGCGSGRVLAAFANRGCQVRGWELAIVPWLIARWRLRHFSSARIHYGDFWRANFSDVDLVYVFLMPATLRRLREKFKRELKSGARVVSYAFPIADWTPERIDSAPGRITIYRYKLCLVEQ